MVEPSTTTRSWVARVAVEVAEHEPGPVDLQDPLLLRAAAGGPRAGELRLDERSLRLGERPTDEAGEQQAGQRAAGAHEDH
jgi:hypothetical protein